MKRFLDIILFLHNDPDGNGITIYTGRSIY
jgi:hypothetical protein